MVYVQLRLKCGVTLVNLSFRLSYPAAHVGSYFGYAGNIIRVIPESGKGSGESRANVALMVFLCSDQRGGQMRGATLMLGGRASG